MFYTEVNQEAEKQHSSSNTKTSSTMSSEDLFNTVMTGGDYAEFCRKSRSSVKRSALKEAVKQAQPMRTKDNLAEALRQIEPLPRSKSRDSERRKFDEENSETKKKEEEEESALELKKEIVINEMKASIEENMKTISDLSQEERVTFRQKRSNSNHRQQER